MKCKVLESFATHTITGCAGMIIEVPKGEAEKFASCGLLEILPEEEQDPEPMAYETAKECIEAENTKVITTRKAKKRFTK